MGSAEYTLFTKYHADHPNSPHKRDTENLEVAFRCHRLRKECGAARAESLTRELRELFRSGSASKDGRRRLVHVPGRIRSPEALPLLCRTAREGRGDLRDAAIASLGFFGAAPAEESFMIFGGRLRSVVFPPPPPGSRRRPSSGSSAKRAPRGPLPSRTCSTRSSAPSAPTGAPRWRPPRGRRSSGTSPRA